MLLVLGVIAVARRGDNGVDANRKVPVVELAYCSDGQVKPCIVSFGVDADDKMLVNLLLPDVSFPAFHMKIVRGGDETSYQCQRLDTTLDSAYCIGEKMPPGEILHLMLISTSDETLLAEGDLSIIGLAFLAPEDSTLTPIPSPTGLPTATVTTTVTVTPTPTQTPILFFPTPTRTKPSYPSYP